MQLEAKKYLHDMRAAAELIANFTEGKSFAHYEKDAMMQSAVERQFEILGEALARLDPSLAHLIPEHSRIIAFRNILIHGYTEVDHRIVWDIVESKLPTLRRDVAALLGEKWHQRALRHKRVHMTKRCTIARVRQNLVAVVHEVERRARIGLARRGKPAVAIPSMHKCEPMMAPRRRFWDAYEKFRQAANLHQLDIDPTIFEDARHRAYR